MNPYKPKINKTLIKVLSISMMGMISITSMFSVFATGKNVEVLCDGAVYKKNSVNYTETAQILESVNVKVDRGDVIIRNDLPDENLIKIIVKRAYDVPIIVDGAKLNVRMAEGTVQDAIRHLGVIVGENDQVIPSPDSKLYNGISIEIIRRKKVVLKDNDVQGVLFVEEETVRDMFKSRNITLSDTDTLNVSLDDEIQDDMQIVIDRISFSEEKYEEQIPFETIKEEDSNLEEGSVKIKTEGVKGVKEVTVQTKTVNGQVVETNKIDETVKSEPKNEVKIVGTKKKSLSQGTAKIVSEDGKIIDPNGNEIFYTKKLTGSCTAYTAHSGARTATGEIAQVGRVAVDPRVIPFGTKLYICSEDGSFVYGYATASDTGGALKSGKALVDLYYSTTSECINFGRRNLAVYVLQE